MAAPALIGTEQTGFALDFVDNDYAIKRPFGSVYPATFPAPLINGYSLTVASGVIRSDMDTQQAQRRVFNTMPHAYTLSFIMTLAQWGEWQQWADTYGYRWFEMNLPSFYAGQDNLRIAPVIIRFTSGISAANLSTDIVQLLVSAEMAPSMYAQYLEAT